MRPATASGFAMFALASAALAAGGPRCCGRQAGIRWRPNDGPIDFDFLVGGSFDKVLAGEFLDKVSSLFFTIGVTLRW